VALDTVVVIQQVGVHMKLRSSNCDIVPIAFGQPVHLDHVAAFHARRMVGPGSLFTAPGQHPAWEGSPARYDWGRAEHRTMYLDPSATASEVSRGGPPTTDFMVGLRLGWWCVRVGRCQPLCGGASGLVNCGDRAVWPGLPVAGKDEIGLDCSEGIQRGDGRRTVLGAGRADQARSSVSGDGVGEEGVAGEQHVVVAEQERGAAGGVPPGRRWVGQARPGWSCRRRFQVVHGTGTQGAVSDEVHGLGGRRSAQGSRGPFGLPVADGVARVGGSARPTRGHRSARRP
jgi:hypothetical protein